MAEQIKQTLKYAEERRTLWLNANSKDAYGRHRGYVLYGMNLSVGVDGNTITVEPGAVYTPYGTRIFFEEASTDPGFVGYNKIDFAAKFAASHGGLTPFSTSARAYYPLVASVIMRIRPYAASNTPELDSLAEFLANVEFIVRATPYHLENTAPSRNLPARDPIMMDVLQSNPSAFPNLSDWSKTDVRAPITGDLATLSTQFNEIPLGYFIISNDAVDLNSPHVVKVQCSNVFEMFRGLLGVDPFAGRVGSRVVGARQNGAGAAVRQDTDLSAVSTTPSAVWGTDPASPKFGTPDPNMAFESTEALLSDADKQAWDVSWDRYRVPSFLRDGDNFLWALRRLDTILRLWLDRTGDQALISTIQDGNATGTYVKPFMQLDAILQHFKGDGGATTNLNTVTYSDGDPTAGAGPADDVLKSGLLPHVPVATPQDASATVYGDSHVNGISALNLAIRHILRDILGVEIPRRALRLSASTWLDGSGNPNGAVLGSDLAALQATLLWEDGPAGKNLTGSTRAVNHPPTLTNAKDAYLTYEQISKAVEKLADRSQAAPINWLRNPNFHAGDFPAIAPEGWIIGGGATCNRTVEVSALELHGVDFSLPGGGDLYQTIDFGSVTLQQLLATNSLFHFSTAFKLVTGSVRVGVRGYAGGVLQFEASRLVSSTSTTFDNYTLTFSPDMTVAAGVTQVIFFIESAAGATLRVLGASMGPGVAPACAAHNPLFYDLVSRDGGAASAMRGLLNMGNNPIGNLGAAASADQAPRADQALTSLGLNTSPLNANSQLIEHIADASSSDGAASAGQSLTTGGFNTAPLNANAQQIKNGQDPTDPQDFMTLRSFDMAGLITGTTLTLVAAHAAAGSYPATLPVGTYMAVIVGGGGGGGHPHAAGHPGQPSLLSFGGTATGDIGIQPPTLNVVAGGGLAGYGCSIYTGVDPVTGTGTYDRVYPTTPTLSSIAASNVIYQVRRWDSRYTRDQSLTSTDYRGAFVLGGNGGNGGWLPPITGLDPSSLMPAIPAGEAGETAVNGYTELGGAAGTNNTTGQYGLSGTYTGSGSAANGHDGQWFNGPGPGGWRPNGAWPGRGGIIAAPWGAAPGGGGGAVGYHGDGSEAVARGGRGGGFGGGGSSAPFAMSYFDGDPNGGPGDGMPGEAGGLVVILFRVAISVVANATVGSGGSSIGVGGGIDVDRGGRDGAVLIYRVS